VLGCLVGAGLIVSGVSPVWAAEREPSGESALIGGFGLGDGLEGAFDEQSGAFTFGVPAAGVNLGWDSRALGVNRHGLGGGWGFGLASVQVDGGVLVFPAAGGAYPADATSPSGLAGYTLGDVRFEQTPGGVLPARADGSRGEIGYEYVLHELGGAATYFNDTGDPLARVNPMGVRDDWSWQRGGAHRLVELIDADGVATALTWDVEGGELVVQPGANLPEPGAPWTVQSANGRITTVIAPDGARTDVRSDASGLVTEVEGPSGACTEVQWRPHLDGVARVDRVRTLAAGGAELSARTWQPAAEGALPSGWPVTDAAPGAPGAGGPGTGAHGFSTVVGDGKTEVESTYNALGALIRRATSATTGSGRVVLKEQSFQYPGTDEDGAPTVTAGELPKHWANPIAATATVRDAEGGERAATQHTEFDDFGRLIAQTAVDGVTHTYGYDQPAPGAIVPPVGLRTWERAVAPDGLSTETRYELNAENTAVVAATGYAGTASGDLVVTGRTEYTVEDDGFISERRSFPSEADGQVATPRVTRWDREVDLRAGVSKLTETIGVGTTAEASETSTASLLHGGVLEQTDAGR
jgi:hypothetical protein